MKRADVEKAAKQTARVQGCDCAVEIEISEIEPNIYQCLVRHDDWCRFLQRRSAWLS